MRNIILGLFIVTSLFFSSALYAQNYTCPVWNSPKTFPADVGTVFDGHHNPWRLTTTVYPKTFAVPAWQFSSANVLSRSEAGGYRYSLLCVNRDVVTSDNKITSVAVQYIVEVDNCTMLSIGQFSCN